MYTIKKFVLCNHPSCSLVTQFPHNLCTNKSSIILIISTQIHTKGFVLLVGLLNGLWDCFFASGGASSEESEEDCDDDPDGG